MPTAAHSAESSERSGHKRLPAILSAALFLLLYCITLNGTYIYDDFAIVKDDIRVHHAYRWKQFWTEQYFPHSGDNLYRPLVSQSYGLEWWLHGDRPWAFHLVNLLLGAGATALVAELGRRLAGCRVGLISGLLFASMPIHVEAVAEIVGRAELACTAAVIGALVLFLHRPMTTRRALAIGLVSIVAMLCKEQGMLMPFLLVPLAWVRRRSDVSIEPRAEVSPVSDIPFADHALEYTRRRFSKDPERQPMMLLIVILCWSVTGLILLREYVLGLKFDWDRSFLDWTIQPMVRSHGADLVIVPISLLGRYVGLILWPIHLSIDYGYAVITPHLIDPAKNPYVILGTACLMAWLVLVAISIYRKWWAALFCLIATALTYSMASNFTVIIGAIFGERLMYMPSAFITVLTGLAIVRLPKRAQIAFVSIAVLLGSIKTVTYAWRWNDSERLYARDLAEQPRSMRLGLLMAQLAESKGDLDTARRVIQHSISVDKNYDENWRMAAIIEERANNFPLALEYAKKAFDLHPDAASADLRSHIESEMDATTRPSVPHG